MGNVESLKELIGQLNQSGQDYRVVGSVARCSYTGEKIMEDFHDVDIILPCGSAQTLSRSDIRVDTGLSEQWKFGNGRLALSKFGEDIQLPTAIFEARFGEIDGVTFKTVSPQALLLMYSSFPWRKKDWKGVRELMILVNESRVLEIDQNYQTARALVKEFKQRRKLRAFLKLLKYKLDRQLPEPLKTGVNWANDRLRPQMERATLMVDNFFFRIRKRDSLLPLTSPHSRSYNSHRHEKTKLIRVQ